MTDAIARELDLDLPLEEAWPAISEPAWLREWLAEEVELELAPGGAAAFTVDGERREGWVEEVVRPRDDRHRCRLAFWWQAEGHPASRVVLELVRTDVGTRLHVSETRPLEQLELVGIPLRGVDGETFGPALIAA